MNNIYRLPQNASVTISAREFDAIIEIAKMDEQDQIITWLRDQDGIDAEIVDFIVEGIRGMAE